MSITSFSFLENLKNLNQHDLFRAFEENLNSKHKSEEIYIKIYKIIDAALFIKKNSKIQYKLFIEEYNQFASGWVENQIELNQLYQNFFTNDVKFIGIIKKHNLYTKMCIRDSFI